MKGFSPRADIQANSFWRLLMPAWPAYLLLFASIPLLVPTLARRLGERMRAPSSPPVARRWIAVVAVLTVLVPAAAIAASSPLEGPEHALTQDDAGNFILTPVDRSVQLRVERSPDGNLLTWDDDPWRAGVFYRVYRSDGDDVECENTDGHPAQSCYFCGTLLESVREHAVPRRRRPAGRDLPDRRGHELGRRPGVRGRVRVQSAGGCGRLSFSSSNAIRCARSTFSSVSRETTVE